MRHKIITNKIYILLFCFCLFSPFIFRVAFLGWFDTPAVNNTYFEAITKDNKVIKVPSNYFLSSSVTVAQQRMGLTQGTYEGYPGHFKGVGSLGSAKELNTLFNAENDCDLEANEGEGFTESEKEIIKKYVQEHHKFILEKVDDRGIINYSLYPHHIFSSMFVFSDFYNLDKRDIIAYKYIVESTCLSYDNHEFSKEVMSRSEYNVDV